MIDLILSTDGNTSYWNKVRADVTVTDIDLVVYRYNDDSEIYGELRVFFDEGDWNVDVDGLIYTDQLWLEQLRNYFRHRGMTINEVNHVTYSEQGMQGRDFVSLDASASFIKAYITMGGNMEQHDVHL